MRLLHPSTAKALSHVVVQEKIAVIIVVIYIKAYLKLDMLKKIIDYDDEPISYLQQPSIYNRDLHFDRNGAQN
jgi:hypothetical protein